jgi:hypothetical protein
MPTPLYVWTDGQLDIGFHAVVGNGHPGSIEVSTGDGGHDQLQKTLGASAAFDGESLTFTATAARNTALPPQVLPLLRVTMFQVDAAGARVNEQTFDTPTAGFDQHDVARLILTLSLVEKPA